MKINANTTLSLILKIILKNYKTSKYKNLFSKLVMQKQLKFILELYKICGENTKIHIQGSHNKFRLYKSHINI